MDAATAGPLGPLRPRWTWLAATGFILVALGPVLFLVAGIFWDLGGEERMFMLGVTVIALLAALAVWKLGKVGKIIGIVAAVLCLGAVWWTVFGLFAPFSFFDFVPGLLVVPGGLIALGCSIAALVAGKRGHVVTAPVGKERSWIRFVTSAVIVLAGLSAVLTYTGRETAADEPVAATIVQKDFEFVPSESTLAAGAKVLVRNDDPFIHSFTVDTMGLDVSMTPGSEVIVTIPASATGQHILYCSPHTREPESPTEDDMSGIITIG